LVLQQQASTQEAFNAFAAKAQQLLLEQQRQLQQQCEQQQRLAQVQWQAQPPVMLLQLQPLPFQPAQQQLGQWGLGSVHTFSVDQGQQLQQLSYSSAAWQQPLQQQAYGYQLVLSPQQTYCTQQQWQSQQGPQPQAHNCSEQPQPAVSFKGVEVLAYPPMPQPPPQHPQHQQEAQLKPVVVLLHPPKPQLPLCKPIALPQQVPQQDKQQQQQQTAAVRPREVLFYPPQPVAPPTPPRPTPLDGPWENQLQLPFSSEGQSPSSTTATTTTVLVPANGAVTGPAGWCLC
jgi:hypothetical protein